MGSTPMREILRAESGRSAVVLEEYADDEVIVAQFRIQREAGQEGLPASVLMAFLQGFARTCAAAGVDLGAYKALGTVLDEPKMEDRS